MTGPDIFDSNGSWPLLRLVGLVGVLAGVPLASTLGDPAEVNGTAIVDRSMIMTHRTLRKQVEVPASIGAVWNAWTTPEGAAPFFAPQAKIELKLGGAYEMYFMPDEPYGGRGSEGCKVLAYLPHEMLAFDWSAPPSIPELRESGARTQVVIEFKPLGPDRTKVVLTQCGFQKGEKWDRYWSYFDDAWDVVLGRLKTNVTGTGGTSPVPDKTWVDGETTVSSFSTPVRRQDFSVELPAPVDKVWDTLTTVEGIRSLLHTDPVIELRPGGRYDLHGGTPTQVLSFVPREMLAVTGPAGWLASAPEKFPTVRKGGTWAVFHFEPQQAGLPAGQGRTRLRMSVVGWGKGEQWDRAYEYFLLANAVFLNTLHKRVAGGS